MKLVSNLSAVQKPSHLLQCFDLKKIILNCEWLLKEQQQQQKGQIEVKNLRTYSSMFSV